MSRKKIISYLLIILTLVMIIDVRYVNSDNNLFEGFITESIEEMVGMENNFFKYNFNQENIKAEKDGSLKLGEEFLNQNQKIKSFNLKNDFGSIEVEGSQNEEINIDYTLKVHAQTKAAAEEFIQNLEINYNLKGENLEISLNKSQIETPAKIKAVEIDYKITIPERLQAKLNNNYGKLNVRNLDGKLQATNRYGSTQINNIKKAVNLNLAYGEAEINDLGSTLDLNSSYAENTIKNISGEFNLESAYGFNKISNLESSLQINSRYGGVEINSVAKINLNSRYTGFTISDVKGKIKANSEYGDFKLSNIEDLELELWYADIEIDKLKDYEFYNYDLSVENGDLEVDFGEKNYDNQNQLQYQGQQAKYDIKINSNYGDILIK